MALAAEWSLEDLKALDFDDLDDFVESLDEQERRWILGPLFDWEGSWAREQQREPLGTWRVWLILAGRGYGKTRTGAEWVRKIVEMGLAKRIALVGPTAADVRDVMIEGESGILAVSPPWMMPVYEPSKRRLTWYNSDGQVRAIATAYSAEKPRKLRGPQHDAAWADEIAAWSYKEAWDNLLLGLRLGERPRVVATTTPKPTGLLKDLVARKSTVVTGGSTYENVDNVADAFVEDILDRYEGTSLGRQELHAELLDEAEGALWKRKWIDDYRWDETVLGPHPDLDALVVAIDPAASKKTTSSETGIVAVGRAQVTEKDGTTRPHFFVLTDRSGRYSPSGWARRSIEAFYDFEADEIVGERNNGGDMVEATILQEDDTVPVETVWASRGKVPRAQPVSALYEQGRVHHVRAKPEIPTGADEDLAPDANEFRELEDQLCQWEPETGMESPDRLDALVWAISHLMPSGRDPKLTENIDLGGGGLDRVSPWR